MFKTTFLNSLKCYLSNLLYSISSFGKWTNASKSAKFLIPICPRTNSKAWGEFFPEDLTTWFLTRKSIVYTHFWEDNI